MGIAVERSPGRWKAAIVFQEKNLEMEPVPRSIAPATRVVVAGRLRAGLAGAGGAGHAAARSRAPAGDHGPARRFLGARRLPSGQRQLPGRNHRAGRARAAGGRQLPRLLRSGRARSASRCRNAAALATLDPALAERQLLDLVDRDRANAGLPPLVRDARLAAVARSYSREMAETGDVAHVSRRTGSVVDRVRAAGVAPAPTTLAENVGSAVSAAEAEQAFMGSPGHRDNLLSRSVTHVGVGVAVGRAEGPTVPLFFTQIFAGWQ